MDAAVNPVTNSVGTPQNNTQNGQQLKRSNKPINNNNSKNPAQTQNTQKARQQTNGNYRSQQGHQNSQNFEGKPRNSRRGGKRYNNNRDEQDGQGEGQHTKPRASKHVAWLRAQFNNYFPDQTLYNVLEQNNFDVERARQQLHEQKQSSWSNVVVKSSPHLQYQAENYPPPQLPINQQQVVESPPFQEHPVDIQENYQPRPKPRYRKIQNNAPEPAPPKEEEYNADEKIEAIQSALELQLSGMEIKAEKLKKLQEDIFKIKADRDVKIEHLTSEKERLVERSQQLRHEILTKEQRITDIDVEVARLKQEKVQKIRLLEEETRALLDDK